MTRKTKTRWATENFDAQGPALSAWACRMSATKRRAKNHQRQQWIYDMDVASAFRMERLPRYAVAVFLCSCGRQAWLMPGGTDEDARGYYDAESDHAYLCEVDDLA